MPITPDPEGGAKLLEYVGGNADDLEFSTSCYAQAVELVNAYVGATEIPADVAAGAVLEVGSKVWLRRNAPNGQAQYADFEASPVLAPVDPLVTVYPVLNRYVVRGMA